MLFKVRMDADEKKRKLTENPNYGRNVRQRLITQIDVCFNLDTSKGTETPVYKANKICHDLSKSGIELLPEEQIISGHSARQIAIFLTSIEQGKDALAKALLFVDK